MPDRPESRIYPLAICLAELVPFIQAELGNQYGTRGVICKPTMFCIAVEKLIRKSANIGVVAIDKHRLTGCALSRLP